MPKTQITSTTLTKCPVCNTEKAAINDPVYGEIACSRCGAVISERIEETPQE
jgi:transcription initiation factor TFIIIB Brf1 subunit/transcription initiation factor TFIIB